MANTRELAQFASFVDFTGTSIGFSTQFNVSGISTFTNAVIFDSTGSIQIPKGTTGQRLSGVLGQIRYNTSLSQFEGYGAGNAWGSLGGVTDIDADTFIRAESAAGEDEDKLEFVTANSTRVAIDSTGKVGIGSTIPTVILDVVGNAKVSGVLTATTFSGSLATTDLTGTITNDQLAGSIANDKLAGSITNDKLAGSIANDKLANSTVSYGGVSLSLGGSDATPAFDLQDATGYPFTSLTGITTDIFGDTTPTLGGNLDANSKDITGVNNLNVSSASTFSGPISVGDTISLGDHDRLRFGAGNDLQIYHDENNSFIDDSGQGDLYIRGSNIVHLQTIGGEDGVKVISNGAVELYNDNSKKFATTGIGVSILSGAGLTATIAGPPNLVIDPGTVGDNTGNVRIKGDLFVDGTTTQINSTALEISDFIVGIATTATTDALADGAGIQIGPSGNTFLYDNTNEAFTSTENLNVASAHTYKIAGTDVLSNDTLGSNVVNSSLTSVGTLSDLTVSGDVSIADKIVHTGDTNTAIRLGVDTFTVETAGSERFRIDSDSKILVGIKTARENLANNASGVEAQFQIEGTSYTSSTLSVIRNSADANDGGIILGKTRSPSTYGNASVVAGDDLGSLTWAGSDGTSLQFGAEIVAEVQSGVGNDDLPTDLLFKTNPGTTNTTERLRITSAGSVGIGTDNPSGKLHVSDGANGLEFNVNSQNAIVSYDRINTVYRPNGLQGSTVSLRIGGVGTALHVDSSAKVGIGTDAPDAKLEVRDASATGIIIRSDNTQSTDTNKALRIRNNSNTNTFHVSHKGQGYFAGSVGIGTTIPETKLHVSDGHTASADNFDSNIVLAISKNTTVDSFAGIAINSGNDAASFIHFGDTDDSNVGRLDYSHSDNAFKFFTNGDSTERLRISAHGKVGINQTSPTADLEVAGTTGTASTIFINAPTHSATVASEAVLKFGYAHSGSPDAVAEIKLVEGSTNSFGGNLTFSVPSNNGSGGSSTSEALRITSDGKIGIGTDNPSGTLTVHGESSSSFRISKSGVLAYDHTFDGTSYTIANNNGNAGIPIIIGTKIAGGESLRITSDGSVGIGTDNPSVKLHVHDGSVRTTNTAKNNFTELGSDGNIEIKRNGGGAYIDFADDTTQDYDVRIQEDSNGLRFITGGQGSASEKLRIDSSGRLLLRSGTDGSTDRVGGFHNALQVEGTGAASASIAVIRNSADDNPPYLNFGKSRGTSVGSNTAVGNGDALAIIDFTGSDGSGNFNSHASIRVYVDGTPGNGDAPGKITFWTTPDNDDSPDERLTIRSDGQVNILGGILNLGTADSSSGHLNAYENMSFNIDIDNDDTDRYFSFHTNSSSASGAELLRITDDGDLKRSKSLSQEVSTSVSSTSATSCGSFAKATYRSAYVIAQITQGSSYQVGRYLVIHDGTTATTIEESAIATGDMLGTFSGVVSGSNVEFRVTMSSASSATVITKIESIVV